MQARKVTAWFVDQIPQRLQPYVRLGRYDKPIGALLVFWPSSWNLALYSQNWYPDPLWFIGYAAGSFMIRAAGCTANDWWDRDLDKKVERCKVRPLAAEELTTKQAAAFFAFNVLPIPVGMFLIGPNARSLLVYSVPLMTLYPLAKRFTYWPQAVLGLAMNFSCLMAAITLTERLDPAAIAMYMGGWCWTMVYDSIYAYQDRNDDIAAGVKSTALLWGDRYKIFCGLFTAGAGSAWLYAGVMSGLGPLYYVTLSGIMAHMTWQWNTVNVADPKDCWNKFISNQWTGLGLLVAVILGKLSAKKQNKSVESR